MSPNQVAKIRRFLRRMWTDLVENPITVVEKQFETAGSSHDDGFLWNYGSWRESRSGGNGQGRMRRRAAWGGGITRDGDKKNKNAKRAQKKKKKRLPKINMKHDEEESIWDRKSSDVGINRCTSGSMEKWRRWRDRGSYSQCDIVGEVHQEHGL